jgi:hypothetical protein
MPLRLEYHYYDITKFMNVLPNDNQQDDEKMVKMKLFLDEMLRQTEL